MDRIPYSSTHQRTIETSGISGIGWSTHELPEFDERLMLATHGMTTTDALQRYPEFVEPFENGGELNHPRIEPRDHFDYRCESGIMRTAFEMGAQKGPNGKWIPIVTHQSNIKVLLAKLLRCDINPWIDIEINNASVTALLIRTVNKEDKIAEIPRPRWRALELGITSPGTSKYDHDCSIWSEHFPSGWEHFSPMQTFEGGIIAQNYSKHLSN